MRFGVRSKAVEDESLTPDPSPTGEGSGNTGGGDNNGGDNSGGSAGFETGN
jgi:hypothetical protein